jgi:hypothetical protein
MEMTLLPSNPNNVTVELSNKGRELLDQYLRATGFENESRVIEEALFTIYDLLQVVKTRDKTRTEIPADRFIGIISTFMRFERPEGY